MAVIISRPGGKSTTIKPSPTYEGVISRYGDVIRAALRDEEEALFRRTILQWREGQITWDELKSFLDLKIAEQAEDSLRRAELEEALVDLTEENRSRQIESKRAELEAAVAEGGITARERYDIERELLDLENPGTDDYTRQQGNVIAAYEDAIDESIEVRRSELLNEFKEGGITLEEELQIVLDLQTIAPEGTKVSRQLIEEEAQLRTSIAEEAERGRGEAEAIAKAEVGNLIEFARVQEESLNERYSRGEVPGLSAEGESLENWRAVLDAYERTGIDQIEGIRVATVQSIVDELEQSVEDRQIGRKFDVLVEGQLTPVTMNQLLTPEFARQVLQPIATLDEETGDYVVIDPFTGQEKRASSEAKAIQAARQAGFGGTFQTIGPEGEVQRYTVDLNPDSATYNAFVSLGPDNRPTGAFVSIPQTPEQVERFKIRGVEEQIGVGMRGPTGLFRMPSLKPADFTRQLKEGVEELKGRAARLGPTIREVGERVAPAAETAAKLSVPGAIFAPRTFVQEFKEAARPITERVQAGVARISPTFKPIERAGRVSPLWGLGGPLGSLLGAGLTRLKEREEPSLLSRIGAGIKTGIGKVGGFIKGLFD